LLPRHSLLASSAARHQQKAAAWFSVWTWQPQSFPVEKYATSAAPISTTTA